MKRLCNLSHLTLHSRCLTSSQRCGNSGFTSYLDQNDVSFSMWKLQFLSLILAWSIKASPEHVFMPGLLDSYLLTWFPSLTLDLSHHWKHFWSFWTVADPGYHHWTGSSSHVGVLLKGSCVLCCQLCLCFAFSFLILLQFGSQYMDKKFKYEVVLATL